MRLDELYAELVPDWESGAVATERLDSLVPDRYWVFAPGSVNEEEADDLVAAILSEGLPFLEEHSDDESILAWIRSTNFNQHAWKLPVALLAMGEIDEAAKIVAAEEARLRKVSPSGWAGFYNEFASRFWSRIQSGSARRV